MISDIYRNLNLVLEPTAVISVVLRALVIVQWLYIITSLDP